MSPEGSHFARPSKVSTNLTIASAPRCADFPGTHSSDCENGCNRHRHVLNVDRLQEADHLAPEAWLARKSGGHESKLLASLMSQKFVENLRKVGRSPRLLGAVTEADALVGVRFECVGKAGPGSGADEGVRHWDTRLAACGKRP